MLSNEVLRLFERQGVVDADQLAHDPFGGPDHGVDVNDVGIHISADVADAALAAHGVDEGQGAWYHDAQRLDHGRAWAVMMFRHASAKFGICFPKGVKLSETACWSRRRTTQNLPTLSPVFSGSRSLTAFFSSRYVEMSLFRNC